MKYLLPVLIVFASTAFAKGASELPVLGTYSALTESEWSVGFELEPGGKATVITEYSYDEDKGGKRTERKKTEKGTWEFAAPYLKLTYGAYQDKLIRSENCHEKRPCFKYDSSLRAKSKSPLDLKYEFIRWP